MAKDDKKVEITYKSADLQPPLFIAGSFSNPPWVPVEMQHRKTPSGEHAFVKAIHVKPGTVIQYKFRVGFGDWWVLDESSPTAIDDVGNRNNLLRVNDLKDLSPASASAERPPTPPPDSPSPRTIDVVQPFMPNPLPLTASKQPAEARGKAGIYSSSGTSTPGFVRTTIEVADTAAQIDPRTPEPEVSDEEAGRTGYRRLSADSIEEAADTAGEVADTAEGLDADVDFVGVDIGPDFSHELPGEEDTGQDVAPMFAYEFAGGSNRSLSVTGSEYSPEACSNSESDDKQGFDPKDPTLERFPSSREGVFERVRTLETGLNEDVPLFDGFPASPVVSAGRKSSVDLNGDSFSISPTATSSRSQNNRHPDTQQCVSRESLGTDASPTPSLQCIMEEAPVDEEDEEGGALPTMPTKPKASTEAPEAIFREPTPVSHNAPTIVVHEVDEADSSSSPREVSTSVREIEQSSALSPTSAQEVGDEQARSATPASFQSNGIDATKKSNWFMAFIRLIFVEWLGGFFGKMFRRRRAE